MHLPDLPESLTSLDLSENYQLTNAGLIQLFSNNDLNSLKTLDLSWCGGFNGEGLINLFPSSLTELDLHFSNKLTIQGVYDIFSKQLFKLLRLLDLPGHGLNISDNFKKNSDIMMISHIINHTYPWIIINNWNQLI